MSERIECDICGEGHYQRRVLDRYDASPLVGVEGVTLVGAPALVCSSCNAVMLEGGALDEALEALTLVLVETDGALRPKETKFLRNALDMTQEELAERLGVHRTTVARWEIGEVPMGKAESMALRALAAMRLLSDKPKLAKELASKFANPGLVRASPSYEIKLGAA
jgi:putative zinc finger/helix-turn-helix YgiT family protein